MTEDDDGVLPLPSLMEAWRPPTGGKRSLRGATLRIRSGGKGRGGSAAAPMLSPAEARAKLERIVRKAPEVMVKISGKQRGARHLAEHFGYISRHGKLEVRSSEGEIVTDEKRLKAIAADWDMLDQAMNAYGKERPTSMSMVLSMPGGTTDAATIHDAVQAFARAEFEGQFSYMVALHTDTAHPHVHLTVATQGADGARFNPRKADLHHWRESFAHELRQRGVAAEATPRRARGHVQKRVRSPAHHLEARTAGQGRDLDLNRLIEERAQAFARSKNPERRVEDVLALGRQKQIRGAYADAAAALAATGKAEDRALAEDIAGFVADMPAAVSRRLERAREIMIADRSEVADRDGRDKDSAAVQRSIIDRGQLKPDDRER
ncbi:MULTISPECIES: relaxase/mobilization nuclease domain-containing protein [unclassified Sphingomonas]|uniref:relaxase/mobilization nuclease domain-containing protein n=1 Tax=unclassified Sphingomonas TaxID=196159 RepID=UPI0006F836F5|nr:MULTISPECIES: relaxase/mobilization nuclease domain-containing protein [unclassified Sphingomonas]KQX24216.1 plasmid stabilization protein [Sphingomonas sp. Root1294]KQY69612.1 plasmid stabilization protein [Sphingomonas sp. Root50]KRB87540.1 plasmid stabilization protein [Sphingomonas sp. Root720]